MLGLAANGSGSPAAMEGSWFGTSAVRDCDFAECTRGGCDATSSPFLCLDEKTAYMGCNAKDWGEYCSDSCTMVRLQLRRGPPNPSAAWFERAKWARARGDKKR